MSSLPAPIAIDRFTRQKQTLKGVLSPAALPRLAEFLAGEGGEIAYELQGSETSDILGRQNKRLKCIISGWFLLLDGESLQAFRHPLAIQSRLVVVRQESDLPPLEEESDDEDYVVCSGEMDVMERIEEEILLNLPFNAVRRSDVNPSDVGAGGKAGKDAPRGKPQGAATPAKKVSPFAKLAALKKTER